MWTAAAFQHYVRAGTAAGLIVLMPELGTLTGGQAAGLARLASVTRLVGGAPLPDRMTHSDRRGRPTRPVANRSRRLWWSYPYSGCWIQPANMIGVDTASWAMLLVRA